MHILDDLTDAQREAVTHVDGPLLVVAGAGSGKTRVVTRRVAYLIEQGVSPFNILAITFTNKAAGEMRERVEALYPVEGMWISTFHSMCARILRRHADRLGYTSSYSIYDTADQIACIKEAITTLGIAPDFASPREIAAYISKQKSAFLSAEDAKKAHLGLKKEAFAQVYAAYQQRLSELNAMDFDDLLVNLVRLFMEHPDLLERYQQNFRYILIDEYQDINHCQYMITRLLGEAHRNVCATGDPDQSIYSWRGADVRNILDFEKDFPDCKTVFLEQNYRSTQNILAAADGLIAYNQRRKPKRLWTENPAGGAIRVLFLLDEQQEADYIAQAILEAVEDGLRYGDIAVFYRVNAQSRVIEEALRRAGAPYEIVMGVEFYQRKEIKDVLAYLRLCANPADEVSFRRVINTPNRGLGKGALAHVERFASEQGLNLLEAVCHPDIGQGLRAPARKGLAAFAKLMTELIGMPQTPVEPFVEVVLQQTGYLEFLEKEANAQERQENVKELASAAAEFDQQYGERATLTAFLEQVALVSETDDLDECSDVVHLMTLHASKGLEFPMVVIAGLEEGLLPHSRSIEGDDVEEERRLCYVGMTRAKQRLVLTHAHRRTIFGAKQYMIPSRFLDEIPAELLDVEDHTQDERYVFDEDDWGEEEEKEYQLDEWPE